MTIKEDLIMMNFYILLFHFIFSAAYHEKCFIVYTAASETYMLLHLLLIWKVSARDSLRAPRIQWLCLKIVIASTIILFIAFTFHRKTCLNYGKSDLVLTSSWLMMAQDASVHLLVESETVCQELLLNLL